VSGVNSKAESQAKLPLLPRLAGLFCNHLQDLTGIDRFVPELDN
jgi:hypothetical protein